MRVYLLCAFAVASICVFGDEGRERGQIRPEQRVLEPFALQGCGVINSTCSSIEWYSQSNSISAVETAKQGRSSDEMRRNYDEIRRSRIRQYIPTMLKRKKQYLWGLLIIIAFALEKQGKVGKCFAAITVVLAFYLVYSQMNSSSETQSTDAREKIMTHDEIMNKLR